MSKYGDSVIITSTDQMLDGMMGNASDKDIDDTVRLVNAIKRFWHHPTDYEPLVAIVDSEYDPSVFQDSLKAEKQPLSNTRYKDIDVYFIDRKDGDKGAGIRLAREEKNGKVFLYFHDAVSLEDYFGRIDRMYDEFDDSYEEETEDEYTEIATKSVRDSDGMMTDYTWYRRNSDGLNIFMFGDKDVYTPDADYADWETESDEQAEEWFDNYDGFEEEFEEEDDFSTTFEADDEIEEAYLNIVEEDSMADTDDVRSHIRSGYPYARGASKCKYFYVGNMKTAENFTEEELEKIAKEYADGYKYALIRYFGEGNPNNYIVWMPTLNSAKKWWAYDTDVVHGESRYPTKMLDLEKGSDITDDLIYELKMKSSIGYYDDWTIKHDPSFKYVFNNIEDAIKKAEEIGAKLYGFADYDNNGERCQVVWTTQKGDKLYPTVVFDGEGKLIDNAPESFKNVVIKHPVDTSRGFARFMGLEEDSNAD